jgi:LysM repeat protein
MKKTVFLFCLILSTLQAVTKSSSDASSTELKILRLRCMEQENKILDLQNQQRIQQEASQTNQAKLVELTASLEQKNTEILFLKQQLQDAQKKISQQSAQLNSQPIDSQKNAALIAAKTESTLLPTESATPMVATNQAQLVKTAETTAIAAENKIAPVAKPQLYQVLAGDSLFKIATQFNVSTQELQKINKIKDPRKIQVGQSLIIPPVQEAK